LSSFGGIDTARYLVPLSAPCAILAGAGVAAILEGTSSSRRNRIFRTTAGAALLASRLGVVAPMAFGAFSQRIFPANKKGLAAVETWRTVATDPELKGRPGYAEFTDFSANWMSDEALCLVSAKRWRYHPYLERLEACDNPWICGKYSAAEDFIRSSGGSCRVRSVHGVRIVDEIQPPAPVEELPWDPSWVVRDEEGRDVEVSLYDDDWSSEVNLSSDEESHCHVDIELPEPNRIVGIEALVDGILTARFWKIEEVQPDGRLVPLGKAAAMQGWFWSGPRLYQFGPGTRWEMRWPARAVSHIRISFVARAPNHTVCLHGIHLLSEEILPDRDLEAVCTAVQEFREKEGEGLRIHADRWLGGKIGAAPDPALKAGYGSGNIDSEPSFSYSNVDFSRPSLAVVRLGEPDRRAERVLDRAGAVFERSEAGGYALFRIPEQASTNARLKEYLSKGIVRFLCGNLWLETQVGKPSERDAPAIATLGGGLFDLLVAEPKTKVARPGQTVPFRLDWRLGAGRDTLEPIHVFVHGMHDGKIAFQGQTLLFPEFVPGPRNLPRFSKDKILLRLPSDLPAGEYDLRIRFCPGVNSKRRLSVETELPTRLRTITLPATLRVDPSAP